MARPLTGGSALAWRVRPIAPGWSVRPRAAWRYFKRNRRARLALIAVLVLTPLLTGGWLWLRHSSLVVVEHVRISGVHGAQAREIRAALTHSAHGMSTLDVKTARLRAAVSSFAVVQEVHASASFPHTLHISVTEQPPVAALVAGSTRTAVAADGVVLGPALLSHALPTISISGPAPATGAHVRAGWSLAALAVLGAAPKPLARVAERVYEGSRGVTLSFHSGLLAYFGDASRARAKWRAFVLVLGDERAASASYVDLRVPERPALGYGSTSAAGEANAAGETESTHESGASLVEALRAAGGEGSSGASGESASGESSSGESSREATSGEAAGGEQSSRERSSTSESGSGEGGETSSREGG